MKPAISLFRFGCLLAALLLAGCATAPTAGSTARAASADHDPRKVRAAALLRIGMHKPQVLDWMGEPDRQEDANNANGMRETWTYEVRHLPRYKTIVAQMELVPYVDPFTGVMKWLEEPVQNQQRIQKVETLTLTFRGPRMIDLERDEREIRTFRN